MTPKYSYRIAWSDDDQAWIAISPEFGRNISAHGDTPQEAMAELNIAIAGAVETYTAELWSLPERNDANGGKAQP